MKCVYDFWHDGKCIINGQGNVSRYETLVKALETGKLQHKIHNKVFILLLLRNLYGKDALSHNMQLSDDPTREEKLRHNMWGGNVGNCKNVLDDFLAKHHPKWKEENPTAYFIVSSWAMHGDSFSTSRCNVADMPQEIKEAIIQIIGDVF